MDYKVALHFEDGATRFIQCSDKEPVTDAAYRQKINVPMDCRDGVCGTCKAVLESGSVDLGDYLEDALSDEEVGAGYVLACQCRPKSDCVLRIAASSAACKVQPSVHVGRLQTVERLSETTTSFAIALEQPGALAFLPGQYVNIEIPGTSLTRAYSFSSPPGSETARFLVRNVPDGRMSGMLRDHRGDETPIRFTGPYGSFYLRDLKRPLLLLAGGTGLAPFLSMLESLAAHSAALPYPVHLIYGVTRDIDLVGVGQLESLRERLEGFSFDTCVAEPESLHPLKGYVTTHVAPEHVLGGDVDIYLCGPPPMVDAVRRWMDETGLKPTNFYYERFSLASEVVAA